MPSTTIVSGTSYWISTEYNTDKAWYVVLTNGNLDNQGDFGDEKAECNRIRPLREL